MCIRDRSWKIAIFRPWFNRFSQNLTCWWSSTPLTAQAFKNWKFWKSKMAAGSRHHEKSQNCDISATVWPIVTKFSMVTQFDTRDATHRKKFVILKIQDGRSSHLKKSKNDHISATDCPISANFCMHVGAYWQFERYSQLEFWTFENLIWRTAALTHKAVHSIGIHFGATMTLMWNTKIQTEPQTNSHSHSFVI